MRTIYKIKFEIDNSSSSKKMQRDQNIAAILSELQDIESDTPIPLPSDGSDILVGSDEFKVISHKYSFNIEGDVLYYQTILKIKSLLQIRSEYIKSQENCANFGANAFF